MHIQKGVVRSRLPLLFLPCVSGYKEREIEIVQLHLQRGKGERDGRNIASVSPPEMHEMMISCRREEKGGNSGKVSALVSAPAYLRNGPISGKTLEA